MSAPTVIYQTREVRKMMLQKKKLYFLNTFYRVSNSFRQVESIKSNAEFIITQKIADIIATRCLKRGDHLVWILTFVAEER